MNNVKKSVLACLALALCSINPVEAKDRKDKDCCNLGTWNVQLITTAGVVPSFTTNGVLTFLRDKEGCCSGTAILDTVPVTVNGTQVGFTAGYGTWTQCGPCTFNVVLAGATDQAGAGLFTDARVLTQFTFTCTNPASSVLQQGVISAGTFTFFSLGNICLAPQTTPVAPTVSFAGTACHLASANCPTPCECK